MDAAEKKGVSCGTELLFQSYMMCHGLSVSIDRKGHYKWNIRLVCLSGNHHHKCVNEDNLDIPEPKDNLDFQTTGVSAGEVLRRSQLRPVLQDSGVVKDGLSRI